MQSNDKFAGGVSGSNPFGIFEILMFFKLNLHNVLNIYFRNVQRQCAKSPWMRKKLLSSRKIGKTIGIQ